MLEELLRRVTRAEYDVADQNQRGDQFSSGFER